MSLSDIHTYLGHRKTYSRNTENQNASKPESLCWHLSNASETHFQWNFWKCRICWTADTAQHVHIDNAPLVRHTTKQTNLLMCRWSCMTHALALALAWRRETGHITDFAQSAHITMRLTKPTYTLNNDPHANNLNDKTSYAYRVRQSVQVRNIWKNWSAAPSCPA